MKEKMNAEKGMTAEELRKEIVRLSQSYHNLGMCYVDFVEKCDELINQFKKDVCRKQRDIMRAIVSANRYKSYLEMKQALTNAPEPK